MSVCKELWNTWMRDAAEIHVMIINYIIFSWLKNRRQHSYIAEGWHCIDLSWHGDVRGRTAAASCSPCTTCRLCLGTLVMSCSLHLTRQAPWDQAQKCCGIKELEKELGWELCIWKANSCPLVWSAKAHRKAEVVCVSSMLALAGLHCFQVVLQHSRQFQRHKVIQFAARIRCSCVILEELLSGAVPQFPHA